MSEKIKVELTATGLISRRPCHVCGGWTEKVSVRAEVLDGPDKGLRVCEKCLEAGDIDVRLAQRATELEASAADVRSLIGRLDVPSFHAWKTAELRADERGAV